VDGILRRFIDAVMLSLKVLRAVLKVDEVVGIAGSNLSDFNEVTVISLFFLKYRFLREWLV